MARRVAAVTRRKCRRCNKTVYRTFTSIIWIILRHSNKPLRIYRCPHGNGFHLTSAPQILKGGPP